MVSLMSYTGRQFNIPDALEISATNIAGSPSRLPAYSTTGVIPKISPVCWTKSLTLTPLLPPPRLNASLTGPLLNNSNAHWCALAKSATFT